MSRERKRDPVLVASGEEWFNPSDRTAVVFTTHSYRDILRHVIQDLGEETLLHVEDILKDVNAGPDAALLWAREDAALRCDEQGDTETAADYRSGEFDDELVSEAEAYRCGQDASTARIEALEEEVRLLNAHLTTAREAYQMLLKDTDPCD